MSELLTGLCPNCGSKLTYKSNESTVMCFACDSSIEVSELSNNPKLGSGASATSYAAFVGFDNPESGVVFLENFFETYDWNAYQHIPDLAIPEIADVIGNNKVKNGAIPETWYLDFMGLYVPVFKKFEALEIFSKEILEKFNPFDNTNAFSSFDLYRSIAKTLLSEKEAIFKTLNSAIGFAERFSLNEDKLKEMKSGIAVLRSAYSKIATKNVVNKDGKTVTVVIETIEEHPEYENAKNDFAERNKAKYTNVGINAPAVYNEALAAYKAGNTTLALECFESIREYSDSAVYIKKINQYFSFFSEMYRFGGKHFIYKREAAPVDTLNIKKSKKNQEGDSASPLSAPTALSLYEVVNGVPAEEPTVKGIDQVITCYGSKLFYFKLDRGIACYDISRRTETIIDTGSAKQYKNWRGEYFDLRFADRAPVFAVKKLYEKTEPVGCFKKSKPT